MKAKYFWNQESAPIEIKVKAKKIPSWTLYNEMAGPQPYSRMIYGINNEKGSEEEINPHPIMDVLHYVLPNFLFWENSTNEHFPNI